MAINTIKSYIILRNDTVAKWAESVVVLKKGEVALSLGEDGSYGAKVGDGVHVWNELPYLKANAKDVAAWAKAAEKPEYDASEIKNLDSYIAGKVQDTNTTYKIEALERLPDDTGTKFQLYKHELSDAEGVWTAVGDPILIPDFDTTELEAKIEALEEGKQDKLEFTGDTATKVVTKDTMDAAIAAIPSAMHFKGIYDELPDPAEFSEGDVVLVGSKEYILCLVDGGKVWKELGDESAYVTKNVYNAKMAEVDAEIAKRVRATVESQYGVARIFNESDGGGAKMENADGSLGFVGVNAGGMNGNNVVIYSADSATGEGARIKGKNDGFYYWKGANKTPTADDEIQTKKNVTDAISNKVDRKLVKDGKESLIFNEADGGGAKFTTADGVKSFVGVNDSSVSATGIAGQLYVVNGEQKTKINMYDGKFCYVKGENPTTDAAKAEREILVRADLQVIDGGDSTEA